VTVKGYVDRVEVSANGPVVARHQRSYDQDQQLLDPLHYLAALGRRPAALEHAPVLRNWALPACFERLRRALEQRHGGRAGVRPYIRVLQRLAEHPLERVQQAVDQALAQEPVQAERIITRGGRLGQTQPVPDAAVEAVTSPCQSTMLSLDQYQVPRPDLGRFAQLLEGEPTDAG
jgi:hypothetical protein